MAGVLGVASRRGKRRRGHVKFSLSEVSFVGGSITCADAAAEPSDLTLDHQNAGDNHTRSPCFVSPPRTTQAVHTPKDIEPAPETRIPTLSDVLWKRDLTWDEVWLTYQRADGSPPLSPRPTKAHVRCISSPSSSSQECVSVTVFGGKDSGLQGEGRQCAVREEEDRSRAQGGCGAAGPGERADVLVEKGISTRRVCPILGAARAQVKAQKQVGQGSQAQEAAAAAVEGSGRCRDATPKAPYSGLFEQPLRVPAADESRRIRRGLDVRLDSASRLFSKNLSFWGAEERVRDDDALQREALHGRGGQRDGEGVPCDSGALECGGVVGEGDMSSRDSSYLTCPTLSFEAALHDTSEDEGVGERVYVDASGSDDEDDELRADDDHNEEDSQAVSCASVWLHSDCDSCSASTHTLASLAQEDRPIAKKHHREQRAGGGRSAVRRRRVGAENCSSWRGGIAQGSVEEAALAVVTRVLERLRRVCGMMDESVLSEWELAQGLLLRDGGQNGFVESARNPVIGRVRDALSGEAGRGWDVDTAFQRVCGRGHVMDVGK